MNLKYSISNSLFRYLAVGLFTFFCEYGSFYALYVLANWNLFIANSISFIIGLCVSFLLNRAWTFKKEEFHKKVHHQAILYITLALFNLIINNLIVGLLKHMSIDPRIGKIIAIATIAIWNFILFRTVIFSGLKSDPQAN